MKLGYAVLLLALAAPLSGCGAAKESPPPASAVPTAAPPLPADVEKAFPAAAPTAGPEAQPAAPAASPITETGEFVSPVRSELAARNPGRVARILVDEGAQVRAGQPLLELEADYLRLELQRAEAEKARDDAAAAEARRDFERKKDLFSKGSVSQAIYDRSQASFDQAQAARAASEAELALARQRLTDATLVSPIDGLIVERRVDVGERMGESTVAFVVVQTAPLRLRFRLPERYLATVQKDQMVRARVDPYPQEVFQGRVAVIVRAVDPSSRTFVVEAEFPNRDQRLRPGLFARVELDAAS